MTRTEMDAMLKADFLTFDGLEDMTYNDVNSSTSTSYTVNNTRKTFQITKAYGESNIRGYLIESVAVTFPVDELAVEAKIGDTFVIDSSTYEVVSTELKTSNTRWRVTGERAYIDSDWDLTCDIQRATLTVNSAGAQVESWADVTTGVAVIVVNNDDVADQINRLGVRGDKQSLNMYMAQSVSVLPMDRIEYSGRYYRIGSIQDEGRIARLKRIVVELLA